jgi:hypothetical protein
MNGVERAAAPGVAEWFDAWRSHDGERASSLLTDAARAAYERQVDGTESAAEILSDPPVGPPVEVGEGFTVGDLGQVEIRYSRTHSFVAVARERGRWRVHAGPASANLPLKPDREPWLKQ